MPWNHRVLRHKQPAIPNLQREDYLVIHEVYFNDDAEHPHSCTKDGVTVGSESIEGLRWVLQKMLEALDKPVLDYDVVSRGNNDDD